MTAVVVALLLLVAGVAGIYLLLKKMSEDGIDIAAPGSCKRGRCGLPGRPLAEEEQPSQPPEDGNEPRQLNS